MGLITEEGAGNVLIISKEGKLQNKDEQTFTTLQGVMLKGVEKKEAKFGEMFILELVDVESGEVYTLYMPERYFNSFGQRFLACPESPMLDIKPWRIESEGAKGVLLRYHTGEGAQKIETEQAKEACKELTDWKKEKAGYNSLDQSLQIFDLIEGRLSEKESEDPIPSQD